MKVSKWASENQVPHRTAYRWANDPKVRAKVDRCRRRALDRAIGQMASNVNSAAEGINSLATNAVSESVKLAALRTIFSNMMAVSEFADLQDRMTQLEEQLDERGALATRARRVKTRSGRSQAALTDHSPWEWYSEFCSCGLPPGECRAHPRARTSQRPPAGDWRVWAYIAGRGAGKTRAGASWIQQRVDDGTMKLGCLIAPTAADIRDVMVEGPSGLIAVAPSWSRPRFESSKRRVEWPNGARAVCLSGEEPERAAGSISTPSGPTSWLAGSAPNRPGIW